MFQFPAAPSIGQIFSPAAGPSYRWNGTGWVSYSPTFNGGLTFTAPVLFADGTLSAPGISWANEPGSGFYRSSTNNFQAVVGNTQVWGWNATNFSVTTQARFADGTEALPGISWANKANSGWARYAPDDAAFYSCNGTLKFAINPTYIYSAAAHWFSDGSGGAPGISWQAETSTGLARNTTVNGFDAFVLGAHTMAWYPAEIQMRKPLLVYIAGGNPKGITISYSEMGTGGQDKEFLYFGHAGGAVYAVFSNGGVWNNQAFDVNISDAGLKTSVVASPDHTAFVEGLQYKQYGFVSAPDVAAEGVIAQDIAALDPSLVTTVNDKLGIYDHRLQQRINSVIPKLIARIKALEAK